MNFLGFICLSSEIDCPVTRLLIIMFRLTSTTESVLCMSQVTAALKPQQLNKETEPPNAAWTHPSPQSGSYWRASRGQQMDRVLSGIHSQAHPWCSVLPIALQASQRKVGITQVRRERPAFSGPVNQTGSRKGFCCYAGVTGHNVTPAAL